MSSIDMKQSKEWKDLLLKSGLPFEYEVKECLIKQGCQVWDEYSYIKHDESNIQKEFSYDLDAVYFKEGNYIDLLIECKYKTEPAKWVFTPNPYSFQYELTPNSFFHPVDYFHTDKFKFNDYPLYKVQEPLGPYCSKGIEILNSGNNETTITRAVSQLSYAFIDKVIDAINNQLYLKTFNSTRFFNIPVIITNAELYVINQELTTIDIKNSSGIEEISTKQDFLLLHNKIGRNLLHHNSSQLSAYFAGIDHNDFQQRNYSFTKDINHFIQVLSDTYCPQMILIMHHDEDHKNYKRLFEYIDFLIKPSDLLNKQIDELMKESQESLRRLNLKKRK